MTGYVSTRYYRAPEIMLTWQKYDVAGTKHKNTEENCYSNKLTSLPLY